MVDTGQYSQLIILNNTDATPTTHFNCEDTTELVFGEYEAADRPGLLLILRDIEAAEHPEHFEQQSLLDDLETSE